MCSLNLNNIFDNLMVIFYSILGALLFIAMMQVFYPLIAFGFIFLLLFFAFQRVENNQFVILGISMYIFCWVFDAHAPDSWMSTVLGFFGILLVLSNAIEGFLYFYHKHSNYVI